MVMEGLAVGQRVNVLLRVFQEIKDWIGGGRLQPLGLGPFVIDRICNDLSNAHLNYHRVGRNSAPNNSRAMIMRITLTVPSAPME